MGFIVISLLVRHLDSEMMAYSELQSKSLFKMHEIVPLIWCSMIA